MYVVYFRHLGFALGLLVLSFHTVIKILHMLTCMHPKGTSIIPIEGSQASCPLSSRSSLGETMATPDALECIVDYLECIDDYKRLPEEDCGWTICLRLACVNHEWCSAVARVRSLMGTLETPYMYANDRHRHPVGDREVRRIVSWCPNLRCVIIRPLHGAILEVTDAGLQMLASTYAVGLKEIQLSSCDRLGLQGWLSLARNCPMLERCT